MTLPDTINGIFELFGGLFILLSIIKLHKDKKVKGISWLAVVFFTLWGYWNLYYYPHLGQTVSFWGGIGVVTMNTIWLGQMGWYIRKENKTDVIIRK